MPSRSRTIPTHAIAHAFAMKRRPQSRLRGAVHGFTLVELMVVIVIIGLLATVVMINVMPSQDRAMAEKARADVAVLDPPRAGAGRAVVAAVAATGARTVVYVSCEPSTLARDLAWFRDVGYAPDHIEGFDLFPGTAHLESVVRLHPVR